MHVVDQANVPSRGHFVRVELGWEPWFALTPNVFPPNSQLASVSVKEGHSSVYLVGLDNEGRNGGRIWAKAYPDSQTAGDWGPWQPIGDTTFRPGAPISVLGLRRGATALYAVGQDEGRGGGQVWTNVFPVDGNWGGWRPLGENVFPVGAPVTAVSSDTDATSLYIVGLDTENRGGGRVWTNAFPVNGTWSGWRPLGENIFPVGAPIAAVSLSRRATSLYLVGLDEDRGGGRVWTKFFPDPIRNNTWSDWSPLSEEVFPVGAPITVTSTTREGTSLFVVGLDNEGRGGGRVWTKAFPSSSDPNQWGPWRPIGENVFPPGAKVSTISHGPGRTSLYLIGITGQVWSTYFPSERGQWAPWFALGPNTFSRLGYLSVVSSVPGGTSLFALGTDSQVWSTYYDPP